MLSIQLVLLTSLVGDTTSINSGTLVNTDESTAAKLLTHKFARKLLKHEPTDEQLSKAVEFVDNAGSVESEADAEESQAESDGEPSHDPPQRIRRQRSKDAG